MLINVLKQLGTNKQRNHFQKFPAYCSIINQTINVLRHVDVFLLSINPDDSHGHNRNFIQHHEFTNYYLS